MATDRWTTYRLLNKKRLSPNMWLYRFALPGKHSCLGWSAIERHIRVRAISLSTGQSIMREYTPISNPMTQNGSFDLAVKLYDTGEMSHIFAQLEIGTGLEMCGPFGDITLQENTTQNVVEISSLSAAVSYGLPTHRPVTRMTMLAAGSGITPMIQILNVMVSFTSTAQPIVDVFQANKTFNDILFRAHLEHVAKEWTNEFTIVHALSREQSEGKDGKGTHTYGKDIRLGRIDVGCLEKVCSSRVDGSQRSGGDDGHFWLLCGSRDFEAEMKVTLVQGLNVSEQNIMTF